MDKLHSTFEDQRGWYKEHGKPRNKLNKGGTKRKGTLGYRTGNRDVTTRWVNPRIGKVQPEAPITKRAKPSLEYVMGDSWNTSNIAETARERKWEWRGRTFDSFEAMNEAIRAQ